MLLAGQAHATHVAAMAMLLWIRVTAGGSIYSGGGDPADLRVLPPSPLSLLPCLTPPV